MVVQIQLAIYQFFPIFHFGHIINHTLRTLCLGNKENIHAKKRGTISAVEESFEELDGAYFITDVEKTLTSDIQKVVEWGVEPENGWEKFVSDLADRVWKQYEMQVKE